MALGVDYSQGYDIQSLKNAGAKFACRYVGFTDASLPQDKIITYTESVDLARAGIYVVSNWEWTADRASINNAFYAKNPVEAYTGGQDDASAAATRHEGIGGPPDRPIYFSVDFASDGSDCVDYFRGLVDTLGIQRVGAYGPYQAIKFLHDNGLITWCWQTYAWSGGQWFPGNHIQQTQNGVNIGTMIVDLDTSMTPDFGQWTIQLTDYRSQQFDDVWFSAGDYAHATGIYQFCKRMSLAGYLPSVFPLQQFIPHSNPPVVEGNGELHTSSWTAPGTIWQSLSNGYHVELRNGVYYLYDNRGIQLVHS